MTHRMASTRRDRFLAALVILVADAAISFVVGLILLHLI
jgi:hypothetical protein